MQSVEKPRYACAQWDYEVIIFFYQMKINFYILKCSKY